MVVQQLRWTRAREKTRNNVPWDVWLFRFDPYPPTPPRRLSMLSTLQCWPPELSEEQRAQLINLATTYSLANSLAYLPNPAPSGPPTAAIHAPFTLIPTPYPRDLFHKAQKLQHIYNVLYSRITLDTPFLDRIMGAEAGVGKVDEFMGSLWKGWKAIRDNNGGKDVQVNGLGLLHGIHAQTRLCRQIADSFRTN